jgi:hypothetical protein
MHTDSPYLRRAAERAGILPLLIANGKQAPYAVTHVPITIEPGAVMHVRPADPYPGHPQDILWEETGGQPFPRPSRLPMYIALAIVAMSVGALVALG